MIPKFLGDLFIFKHPFSFLRYWKKWMLNRRWASASFTENQTRSELWLETISVSRNRNIDILILLSVGWFLLYIHDHVVMVTFVPIIYHSWVAVALEGRVQCLHYSQKSKNYIYSSCESSWLKLSKWRSLHVYWHWRMLVVMPISSPS